MTHWHPENLVRGKLYLIHLNHGGTVETVQFIFGDIESLSNKLMLVGQDQRTKNQIKIEYSQIAEIATL